MSDAADAPKNLEQANDAFHDATITFLFTDVEGSTALWQNVPQAMRSALERHDTLLQNTITQFGGNVFKRMGDAFHAAFPNAASALEAAISAQRALNAPETPGEITLRVRMALNSGAAQQRDGDYYGGALSRTARLRDALHGGQIALTQAAVSLLRDSTASSVFPTCELRDLGLFALRDLNEPERIFQVIAPDLPSTFPPLRTAVSVPHNLPRQFTSFIGREREITETTRLLNDACLVTITGPGGSGKTRLAVEAAAEQLSLFRDGVWFIDLGPLTEPAQVAQTVAAVLGIREESGRSIRDAVVSHLQAKHLLLLLDNCEHLIEECARFAQTLLVACPHVKILATSRESLDIPGEIASPLLPLPQPDGAKEQSVARIARYESVRLFTERAITAAQNFALTRENAGAVARICRRLDGIPLALELAAAWTNVLTPQQIEARLDDRFRFLSKSSRTALPRQQTLRAAMDWSYDLLGEAERLLLARLSVFSGSFNLNAAEQICADESLVSYEVLELLYQLVHKSLVVRSDEKGEARFRLLESIRQYNEERLEKRGETLSILDRHLDFYLALSEEAEPHLQDSKQQNYLDNLALDYDNLRAALGADIAPEQRLRMATALHRFWLIRGYSREGQQTLENLLNRTWSSVHPVSEALAMRAENAVGILAMTNGDWEGAKSHLERSAELSKTQNDLLGEAKALTNLGIVASQQGEYEDARKNYEKSAKIYRVLGDDARLAICLSNLGAMANDQKDFRAAVAYLSESLAIDRIGGERLRIADTLHNYAVGLNGVAEYKKSRECLQESLKIRHEIGDQSNIATAITQFAIFDFNKNNWEQGVLLLSAAKRLYNSLKISVSPFVNVEVEAHIKNAKEAIPEQVYSLQWERGQQMSEQETIEFIIKNEL